MCVCVCAVNIKCSLRLAHTQPAQKYEYVCVCVYVRLSLWLCGNSALHMHRHAHQHHKTEGAGGSLVCWRWHTHRFTVATVWYGTENCRAQSAECRRFAGMSLSHVTVICTNRDKEIWSDHNRISTVRVRVRVRVRVTHIRCGNSGNLLPPIYAADRQIRNLSCECNGCNLLLVS